MDIYGIFLKYLFPNDWWQYQLIKWMLMKHPDKLRYSPKIIRVTKTQLYFGMKKHYGVIILPKSTILNDLKDVKSKV